MRALDVLLIAGFLLCADNAAASSNLRFHASFDLDATADVSRGRRQPVLNAGLRLTDGRIGKAVVLDARSRLAFETAGHINPGSGTIVMWMRARSETLETEKFWRQKLDYLHENPCRKGLVTRAAYWRCSSAAYYVSDGKEICTVRLSVVDWT